MNERFTTRRFTASRFIARCGLTLVLPACAALSGCSADPHQPGIFFDERQAAINNEKLREEQARTVDDTNYQLSRTGSLQAQRDQLQRDVASLRDELTAIQQQLADLQRTGGSPAQIAGYRTQAHNAGEELDSYGHSPTGDPAAIADAQRRVAHLRTVVDGLKEQVKLLSHETQ